MSTMHFSAPDGPPLFDALCNSSQTRRPDWPTILLGMGSRGSTRSGLPGGDTGLQGGNR